MKIIECPRDAMQGLHDFIPTDKKVAYINKLLEVGFHTLDCGSFVSPKAIPQMRDTAEVINRLELDDIETKLSVIVANQRGALEAAAFEEITYLGYPFSISESFQVRNTKATIAESVDRVNEIQEICVANNKELLIYISMGFGNPYGDPWNVETVQKWVNELAKLDINLFMLSDTVGLAQPASIAYLFSKLIPANPALEIGAHFHTTPTTWEEKVKTAFDNGCRRFDGTIKGLGGCPMAQDELLGNMPSENLIAFAMERKIETGLNMEAYTEASILASEILKG